MSHKQAFHLNIVAILVLSFLAGCGGSAPTAGSEASATTSVPEQDTATPTLEQNTATPTPEQDTATPKPTKAPPRVFFVSPADGESVTSPVHVTMGAENFIIEPAGVRNPGAGHLHIIVDAECIKPNQDIPKDETHLHFPNGELEADLDLAPGTHTLCLQAGDGYHTALFGEGMTQTITITVE
jgi:hypothetical protein